VYVICKSVQNGFNIIYENVSVPGELFLMLLYNERLNVRSDFCSLTLAFTTVHVELITFVCDDVTSLNAFCELNSSRVLHEVTRLAFVCAF